MKLHNLIDMNLSRLMEKKSVTAGYISSDVVKALKSMDQTGLSDIKGLMADRGLDLKPSDLDISQETPVSLFQKFKAAETPDEELKTYLQLVLKLHPATAQGLSYLASRGAG